MTLAELTAILRTTGYPVAYSHFIETPQTPLPKPPYITYLVGYSSNFFADNKVYQKVDRIQVELYTDKPDLQAQAKIETALNDNELPFDVAETYLESERLYQRIYEIGVI